MSGAVKRHVEALLEMAAGRVELNKPLAGQTSYGIGGAAEIWVAPGTEEAVGAVIRYARRHGLPVTLLGHGSNVLVADGGVEGLVLAIGENLSGVSFDKGKETATALAGTKLQDFVHQAALHGLAGVELLVGIPGGIGGAVRMNAGAFGQEIESSIRRVFAYSTTDGSEVRLTRDEIRFGYRTAPEIEGLAVTAVEFELRREDPALLSERMEDILKLRAKKQPLEYPSCGSVFKRPPGYYAGALIEEVGMKGSRIGGAMISPKHAGFIVNTGGATASDVRKLMGLVERRVTERFGVQLEREVQLIGFEEQVKQ